jgi:steroid delta-isomerase-like uncharacterized protein
MSEANRNIARRYFDEVILQRNLDAVDDLLAPDCVLHPPSGDIVAGRDNIKTTLGRVGDAFPERDVKIELEVADENAVAVAYTYVLTHLGDYRGLAPTGKVVNLKCLNAFRVEDGRVVELRVYYNPALIMEALVESDGSA